MAKKERAASFSHIGIKQKIKAWFKDHQRVSIDSLQRIWHKPLASLVTIIVIAIALALPVSFYVSLANIYRLGESVESNAQVSLYLDKRASEQAIINLQSELQQWPEIAEIRVIGKEQALVDFKKHSGFADVLSYLDTNPLPVVLELTPQAAFSDKQNMMQLLAKLQKNSIVDVVQLDMLWLERLNTILSIGQRVVMVLVLLLSMGVLLVIGNTIRLEIENRRNEILVVKLVGATDTFVRRPFLYSGIWYGLAAGIGASLIVLLSSLFVAAPIKELAGLYQSDYQLRGLTLTDTLSLWLMSALLGYGGAWLSVSRHLDNLEPK